VSKIKASATLHGPSSTLYQAPFVVRSRFIPTPISSSSQTRSNRTLLTTSQSTCTKSATRKSTSLSNLLQTSLSTSPSTTRVKSSNRAASLLWLRQRFWQRSRSRLLWMCLELRWIISWSTVSCSGLLRSAGRSFVSLGRLMMKGRLISGYRLDRIFRFRWARRESFIVIQSCCHGLGFSSKPGSTIATTLSYSTHIYRVNTPILNTTSVQSFNSSRIRALPTHRDSCVEGVTVQKGRPCVPFRIQGIYTVTEGFCGVMVDAELDYTIRLMLYVVGIL
jgi:hypothetical protein